MFRVYVCRRLKKIALIFIVLVLCVHFVLFITSTFNRQRDISMPKSSVCSCQAQVKKDFKDKVIDSRIHGSAVGIESTKVLLKHIKRMRKENTAKSSKKISTNQKVGTTRPEVLNQPIMLHSAVRIDTIKSDLIFCETNGTSLRSEVALANINTALSTVKYIHNIKENSALVTDRNSPIITAHSIEENNAQPTKQEQNKPRSKPSSEHTVTNPLSNEKPVLLYRFKASLAARKLPLPNIKKVPSSALTHSKAPNNKESNSKKLQATSKTAQVRTPTPRKTPPSSKKRLVKQTHNNNTMKDKSENKMAASTLDFSWKTLTKTLSIFSSYLDSRYLKTKEGLFQNSVVIFGYELGILSQRNLSCVVIMRDDERVMLKEPALRIILAETWKAMHNKYRAILYRCNLTMLKTPRYVTLIDSSSYAELHSIPQANFIPVVDPHFAGVTHEFGVCYETPLYGNKYDQGIMDSIEMNKLLGATWFTIYVHEANEKALEILRYYSRELKILDALFNWGKNLPNPVYNRGLLAGVHDCVYRNMYKVRYLVLCDLDEVIIPVKSLNWHELLLKIDKPKLAYFVFRHLGFHKNLTKSPELLHCPGQSNFTYKMPRFFATHNRSVSVISKNHQTKSIAKPKYSIVVHVHYFRTMLPGYKVYFVPTDVALMKHFRDKDDPRYKNYNSTLDFSMDRFKPAILAAVEKHYCGNIKHVAR